MFNASAAGLGYFEGSLDCPIGRGWSVFALPCPRPSRGNGSTPLLSLINLSNKHIKFEPLQAAFCPLQAKTNHDINEQIDETVMRKIPQIVLAEYASLIVPVYSSVYCQAPYDIHLLVNTALVLFPGLLVLQSIYCVMRSYQHRSAV
jgi:hypothetical protein